MNKMWRTIFIVIGVIILVFFMLWANTFYRQWTFFTKAEKLHQEGKLLDAIAFYESAIRMYTPASTRVEKSVKAIWQLGLDYQQEKRYEEALIAFRSLKTSLYAIRSFYSPFKDWRDRAEDKISLLQVEMDTINSSSQTTLN